MKGRKPKPLALQTAKSHKKKIPSPVEASGTLGDPPSWLSEAEASLYAELAESMPDGLLRECDTSLFARYVASYALFQSLRERIAELEEITPATPEQYVAASKALPGLMRMQTKQSELMLRMESEMGTSPSARSRIAMIPKTGDSEFERFMNRQPGSVGPHALAE
jgi:P27 family predicted phage terminase small subunit